MANVGTSQEAAVSTRDMGTWWDGAYLEGRGLVLFGDKELPLSQKNEVKARELSAPFPETLYSPFGLVFPALGGSDGPALSSTPNTEEKFVMILRLQSDLESEPGNARPATFEWQNDSGSESWMTKSAVITEFYFPGIGGPLFRANTNDGIGFHVVAGASWDRFDGDEDQIDSRKFKLLGEFVAFPATIGRVMNSSQLVKVGVTYEEDAVRDLDRYTLDLHWNPAIGLPVWFSGGSDQKIRTLWIGGRTYIEDGKFIYNEEVMKTNANIREARRRYAAGELTAPGFQEAVEQELPSTYLSVKPDVGLELGESEEFSDVLSNFTEGAVRYGIEVALSFREPLKLPGKVDFVYKLIGRTFFDGGDNHVFHEASVVYKGKYLPMSVSASYEYGENAPDYVKRDLVKVGVGLKF
ncbi:hypothetical protein FEM03_16195 [Phragmitibacter flavus]|uniref:Uncharacterized protein n=2 Tax=Phragmitibacter flavus TaxID=2576071 RepID=A0A5R8KE33_9BACT|nr:hypothetical protein FEM03_16195 [Phragmitibacter flavus]